MRKRVVTLSFSCQTQHVTTIARRHRWIWVGCVTRQSKLTLTLNQQWRLAGAWEKRNEALCF